VSFYVSTANFFFAPLWRMGPRCSSAETQVCHRSYIIAARFYGVERHFQQYFSYTVAARNRSRIIILPTQFLNRSTDKWYLIYGILSIITKRLHGILISQRMLPFSRSHLLFLKGVKLQKENNNKKKSIISFWEWNYQITWIKMWIRSD
jgi:hypothetical protein